MHLGARRKRTCPCFPAIDIFQIAPKNFIQACRIDRRSVSPGYRSFLSGNKYPPINDQIFPTSEYLQFDYSRRFTNLRTTRRKYPVNLLKNVSISGNFDIQTARCNIAPRSAATFPIETSEKARICQTKSRPSGDNAETRKTRRTLWFIALQQPPFSPSTPDGFKEVRRLFSQVLDKPLDSYIYHTQSYQQYSKSRACQVALLDESVHQQAQDEPHLFLFLLSLTTQQQHEYLTTKDTNRRGGGHPESKDPWDLREKPTTHYRCLLTSVSVCQCLKRALYRDTRLDNARTKCIPSFSYPPLTHCTLHTFH